MDVSLIPSRLMREDCEFFWVGSVVGSCDCHVSLVSNVSSIVLASCDTEMCLEVLCLSEKGEDSELIEQHGVFLFTAIRTPSQATTFFFERLCQRRARRIGQRGED